MSKRESWKSRIGFIFAALGSAVGLGAIWRFPYIVGENGGAAFILLYVFCLLLIGFPVLVAEILAGRTTHTSPSGAFLRLGRNRIWEKGGKLTILTGFIISSFYSVVGGWTLGYFFEALLGNLNNFSTGQEALAYFQGLSSQTYWTLGLHFLFMGSSLLVLLSGVRKGIEAGSKIMMPLLIIVLLIIMVKGLTLPNASKGLAFLFSPNWNQLTPRAIVLALGQAFFTLSLGQGTMVTYGSYLASKEDIPKTVVPVVILNTLIALLAGIAIFTIVFSVGLEPSSGPALLFETLPVVFSGLSWGWVLAVLFFLLVVIAALTSQISALEPAISYLIDEKKWSRKPATSIVCLGAFLLGVPSVLSFSLIKDWKIHGATFFDMISFLSINILVPFGGLLAVLLVAWRWGMKKAFDNLKIHEDFAYERPILHVYFNICLKYIAPVFIILILCDLLGLY